MSNEPEHLTTIFLLFFFLFRRIKSNQIKEKKIKRHYKFPHPNPLFPIAIAAPVPMPQTPALTAACIPSTRANLPTYATEPRIPPPPNHAPRGRMSERRAAALPPAAPVARAEKEEEEER